MPETGPTESPDDRDAVAPPNGRVFSAYGIASAALGVLSAGAVALAVVIWLAHRDDVGERHYQSRVLRTAAEWTGVLINMNTDNVDASLRRLHDETVGELNVDFDAVMAPYRQVVQRLKARSTGRIEAVAIESVRRDPGAQPDTGRPTSDPLPRALATRTDTVMVVATSVAENAGGKPQTVRWNLRLDVSDVDGKLMISRVGSIR
ncbi:hypothetical protein MSM1_05565 [Mycobacterium sp. SM1]|uniref:hypothetical protein n=1 Tax=Mycobacterium sp. SM1 TaxID=2816243 RepID=UPI001BD13E70|nr:hypothetical protein [Mycobacterium sp. SM1]MBS4727834.1 hypothetical protein [Mycobacterium sp. SM1]